MISNDGKSMQTYGKVVIMIIYSIWLIWVRKPERVHTHTKRILLPSTPLNRNRSLRFAWLSSVVRVGSAFYNSINRCGFNSIVSIKFTLCFFSFFVYDTKFLNLYLLRKLLQSIVHSQKIAKLKI